MKVGFGVDTIHPCFYCIQTLDKFKGKNLKIQAEKNLPGGIFGSSFYSGTHNMNIKNFTGNKPVIINYFIRLEKQRFRIGKNNNYNGKPPNNYGSNLNTSLVFIF